MDICPNCGANIEGLTHHCDCCGTLLSEKTSFFIWHTFVTEASGDLYVFMRDVFERFNEIDFSSYTNVLQNLEINVFCYPDSILTEQRIHNKLYVSTSRMKAKLTVVLDYDKYINSSTNDKITLLSQELKAGLVHVQEKVPELKFGIVKCMEIINAII